MEYKDKLKQCDIEARYVLGGLIATVVVWSLLGFGLSSIDVEIFQLPLWVVAGCGGTFLFMVVITIIFCKFVMKDVDLSDISQTEQNQ